MLFCTGSTGILGAIGEGVNGDSTVLLTKSVMDIFAAFAFAAHMGPMIACIAPRIPVLPVQKSISRPTKRLI